MLKCVYIFKFESIFLICRSDTNAEDHIPLNSLSVGPRSMDDMKIVQKYSGK